MSREECIEKPCFSIEVCTLGGEASKALNIPLRMSTFVIGNPLGSGLVFVVVHTIRLAANEAVDSLIH
jgi:hypothetical protein